MNFTLTGSPLTPDGADELLIEIAKTRFGPKPFRRSSLSWAVREHLVENGLWTESDDACELGWISDGERLLYKQFDAIVRRGVFVARGGGHYVLVRSSS